MGVPKSPSPAALFMAVLFKPEISVEQIRAVAAKDYPVAQAAFFLIAVVMILMNLMADLLYSLLDPRVSHERR